MQTAPPEVVARRRSRVRERDLQGHFTHEQADPTDGSPEDGTRAGPQDGPEDGGTDGAVAGPAEREGDAQLDRAISVLKSWSYFERLRATPAGRADAPHASVPTALAE